MKVWPLSRFWALRPQITARRLELACWLSGLALTAALLAPVTSANADAPPRPQPRISAIEPTGSTSFAASLAASYQTRCIRRVIALANYWPSLDIGRQIDRQCFISRMHPGGFGTPAAAMTLGCATGAAWKPAVRPTRPPGCPSN